MLAGIPYKRKIVEEIGQVGKETEKSCSLFSIAQCSLSVPLSLPPSLVSLC